jgi:hypothetical protein
MDLRETGWDDMDRIHPAQDRDHKILGNSWVTERLAASQIWLSSMEIVTTQRGACKKVRKDNVGSTYVSFSNFLLWSCVRSADPYHWLTSWSWVFLEKPPLAQLLKNFPTFYATRRFITVSQDPWSHLR